MTETTLKKVVLTKKIEKMKTNLAQRFLDRYESEDFKNDYAQILFEEFLNNEHEIINRISDLFNISNYECQKFFDYSGYVTKETCKKVYDFISENFERFTENFSGYYVGYTSLESIEFGEQEEQISEVYNHQTGKSYGLKYLQKLFSNNGYYVKNDLCYYVVSGGLHVDLCNCAEEINEILNQK